MKTLRLRVCSARLFGPAVAGLLLAGTIAPSPVSADTDLTLGGTGVIAYANGDNVRLRVGPGYDEAEIARYPEGTAVEVLDGTFAAADGTSWYKVSIDGETGYVVSDFLANSSAIYTDTTGRAVTNDSVNLRGGPSTADDVVGTLDAGETVTLTGGESDGWLSVSATGGDGWVYGAFLGSDGSASGTRYTIDTVHLRTGPSTGNESMAYLPVGVQLELTGEEQDGFVKVTSSYGTGWVFAQYIGDTAPENPAPENPAPEAPAPEAPATEAPPAESTTRYTIDTVHLRTGPGTEYDSITYLEVGVQLELTGEVEGGFAKVTSEFGTGWVAAEFIGTTVPAAPANPATPEPETPATPEPAAPAEPSVRYTTDSVNLRAESSASSNVIAVIASGTEVEFAGETANGFARVTTDQGAGWIASEFLSETRPAEPSAPEPQPGSLLIWPVSGGEWYVSQGYNGSSHQNETSSWQYYYSFDLKRTDGDTAGQPVYSAVNGTVRWIDEAFGGMSIYMGNGLAYAYFHTRIDPSIQEGDTITQGQYMGTIAPAGEAGSGSSAHLHITVWETSDGGNWSRVAVPFTGQLAISGTNFPATGAGNDYLGYTFNP
jgi:uncharacterized protein YgiM (DUF1202 family)